MNHYAIETMAKSRHADLQTEARMARLARDARGGRRVPDVTEGRILGHRLASATAGLVIAVVLVAGTALAQADRPAAGTSTDGNQTQVTKPSDDDRRPRLPGGRAIL